MTDTTGTTETPKTFECAHCHGIFPKPWTDDEIDAEYSRTHPDAWADGVPFELLCAECDQAADAPVNVEQESS